MLLEAALLILPAIARNVYVPGVFNIKLPKDATPDGEVVEMAFPVKTPDPEATVIVIVTPLTALPKVSNARTVTIGESACPAVVVDGGLTTKASFVTVAGVIRKTLEIAVFSGPLTASN